MSTGNTGATLQPSRSATNTLTSNDDTPVRYDSGKEHSNVSCNVFHWRSGAVCSWTYSQVILRIDDTCLAASDSANSGQASPSRVTPSLAKSVPEPDERPSHGCHLPYPSRRANPYSGYPTRSVPYCPLSRVPVPRQVGPIMIPPFVIRC